MRKLHVYLAALCTMLLWGCSSENFDGSGYSLFAPRFSVTLSVEGADAAGDAYNLAKAGRAGVYVAAAAPVINRSTAITADGTKAGFVLAGDYTSDDKLYIYYPYSSSNTTGKFEDGAEMKIPSSQEQYAAGRFTLDNMPMLSDGVALTYGAPVAAVLKPQGALVRLNVYSSGYYIGERVTGVEFAGNQCAGSIRADFAKGTAAFTAGASKVTLSLANAYNPTNTAESAEGIYLVVAPATYSATVTVTTNVAKYTLPYAKSLAAGACDVVDVDLDNTARTEIAPDEQQTHYKLRWFELPVQKDADNNGIEDGNADWYYSHTMRADAPAIRNFSACYSKGKVHPVWVAAPMHDCYTGSFGRPSNEPYKDDPQIPIVQAGKFNFGVTNLTRGHMVGSAERNVSVETQAQAYFHSNIGAQLQSGFNEHNGAWNNLESVIDKAVCPDTLYQVIGVVFTRWTDRYNRTVEPATTTYTKLVDTGANTGNSWEDTAYVDGEGVCSIPTAWYKVVLRTREGNTGKRVDQCSADELQCVAFILGHYSNSGHKPSADDMYSVSELETLTGLTFFPNVPNAPKDIFNDSDWL